MQLLDARIILTGASSGIGREMAFELNRRGAGLVLVGRREKELQKLEQQLSQGAANVTSVVADVTTKAGRDAVISHANQKLGGIDILINNAGISDFAAFENSDPAKVEQLYKTNVIAPVLLTQSVLPQLLTQGRGKIVNLGSIFGSIGFPLFAAYSSSKFAIRGFSEALRRELVNTGVGVTYVAPRSVKTSINSEAVYRMAEAVKMKMDDPGTVARWIVSAIEKDKQDVYYGLAERIFVKLNSILPRLVDKGVARQNQQMRNFVTASKS
jgi:short-subunit dehydrogenase